MTDQTTPALPTLADMSPKERAACQWVHADTETLGRVVIVDPCWEDGIARVVGMHPRTVPVPWEGVTPRPDLSRMEWPAVDQEADQ